MLSGIFDVSYVKKCCNFSFFSSYVHVHVLGEKYQVFNVEDMRRAL